ncbi:MAG: hypothetical protein AAGI71_04580 [Bacteroidota bacterium]
MKRFVAYLSAFALMLTIGVNTAAAQGPYAEKSDAWWAQLGDQLTESINSPVEQVKVQTIRHIIFFSANHSDKVNLDGTVPVLLRMYDGSADEKHRVLALAAIDAIGSNSAMEYLAQQVETERSEKVQRMMVAMLNNHFNGGGAS